MNVSKQEFLFEVPELYPNTDEHIAFWRQERLRCIEGYWASGYWMPGKLYFYVNYSTIKLNKQPKVKSLGKPWLRDIEWNFFRLLDEAKGFSGFIDDPDYSCHEALTKPLTDDEIVLEYCTDLQTGKTIEEKFYNIYKNQFFEKKEYVSPRDYLSQQHAFNKGRPLYNNQSQNLMMIGARGFGKDLHKDTLLWYEDKEAPISEVKVGDRIYNHLGELVNVTNVYTFNDQLQYEIILSDGRTIKCGAGHKWQFEERQRDGSYKTVVKELKDILPDYRYGKRGDAKYFIKYCDPIQYPHKNLPIDPYTLGALLGDGGLTQRIVFTTDDPEILREFILPENCKIKKLKSKYAYSIVKKQGKLNPLTETLKELGLFGKKSTEKFIPEVYMRSSAEQRIHLLQGLMDTDGSITKNGQIEFSQSNKILAEQVRTLCETLGIRCKLVVRKTKKRDSYRLNIITSNPIFRLQRKLKRLNLKPSKYAVTNRTMSAIRNIKPLEVDTSYCISVDGPDNLFLAGSCIPTHNSYMIGAVMAHEFLFDGLTKYTSQKDTKTSSEIVAGAGDAKYSSDTLDKVKLCLEHLPGEMEIRGRHFPSPFTKRYTGSWYPGKQVVASYKKKMGGTWKHVGTKSSIKHRTFKDNPFAANGTRPGIMTFEEVGMFDNLKESYAASVECQRDGAVKFGTMIFIGTGGDMKGGGTRDAHEIFYNPTAYDCLQLEDTWEHRGKIGFFVPAYLGLNQYKNENGFTDEARAKKYLEDHRRKLLSAGSTTSLDGELINRPIKPSEIFLLKHGNIFPIHELQDRLSTIDRPEVIRYLQTPVHLYYDEKNKGGINYKVETKGNLRPINDFPFNGDDREGAVTIYEFPEVDEDGNVPKGLYIIGHDPYSSDDPAGASLASIYVLKTKKHLKYGHDEIVASFVGRPYHGRNIVNEHLMKLSMFYGDATIYFENATGNTKEFFEKYRKLHLLAKQPQTILTKRAAYEGKSPNIYGYPMSSRTMKTQAIQYLRDWLLEERGADDDGKIVRNLDRIPDKALLQELIAFNMEGNFDRVMGFAGCIIGLEETHNQYLKQNEEKSQLESAIQFFSTNRLFKQTINARF